MQTLIIDPNFIYEPIRTSGIVIMVINMLIL